ncbi:MAG TPA: regulatory protein RecX [Vicinamibacterales bacterium]|nr:regulatory protein RecX [Vicinamibacterales bacterium]
MSAYSEALKLLSRRELTTSELRERLLKKQVPPQDVDETVRRLSADGTLNDRRAAVTIARTHALVKARGRLRIERELRARGVSAETTRAALDEVFGELSEPELLERALRKRLRSGRIHTEAEFRRLYQYLLRLGFPPDAVLALLKKHSRIDV